MIIHGISKMLGSVITRKHGVVHCTRQVSWNEGSTQGDLSLLAFLIK